MRNDNIIFHSIEKNLVSYELIQEYKLDQIIFFDIECTGFSKEDDRIFAISIGEFKERDFYAYTLFNAYDERKLLVESLKLFDRKNICTFNGMALDVPFLNARLDLHNMDKLSYQKHYDFYRILTPYVNALKSTGKSLKNFEELLGISRIDTIDGKECRDKYYEYVRTNDENIRNFIVTHNYEDVINLPKLFELVYMIKHNNILRDDVIDDNQYMYIKKLLENKEISSMSIEKSIMSQKDGRKLIYELKRKSIDIDNITEILEDIKYRASLYK